MSPCVLSHSTRSRAISSYHDHIRRSFSKRSPNSIDDFLAFTVKREGDSGELGTHTLPAAPLCGMDRIKYDVLVPLESLHKGFEAVARAAPAVKLGLLTTGWEQCTHDGGPSILGGTPEQGHLDKSGPSPFAKERSLDLTLCNTTTARAVFHRHAVDYATFAESDLLSYGNGPHKCLT